MIQHASLALDTRAIALYLVQLTTTSSMINVYLNVFLLALLVQTLQHFQELIVFLVLQVIILLPHPLLAVNPAPLTVKLAMPLIAILA